MKQNRISTYLEQHHSELMDFRQDMKRMVVPVLIEQLAAVLMGVVSTIISSQLGPAAISAIGSVSTLTMLVIGIFSSLSIGGTVVVAQYIGRNEHEKANKTAGTALLSTAIFVGFLIVLIVIFRRTLVMALFGSAGPEITGLAVQYLTMISFYFLPFSLTSMGLALLRGSGDMKTPMQVSLITNIINAVLSYPLIYGFAAPGSGRGLGVSGAALATIIAQSVGMILVFYILRTGHRSLSLRGDKVFRIDFATLKNILFFGVPAGAEQMMFNGGKLVVQTFIVSLGMASIAANSIVNSILGMVGVVGSSFSVLATTLVGQLIGAGLKEKARKWNLYITATSCLMNIFISLLFFPLAGLIVRAYTSDQDSIKLSTDLIRMYLIVLPLLHAPSFALPSGLRGAGDVRYTMVVSILSMWFMRVGASYLLTMYFGLGVHGIWIGMYLDWFVRGAFFLPRSLGRKWLRHKTVS